MASCRSPGRADAPPTIHFDLLESNGPKRFAAVLASSGAQEVKRPPVTDRGITSIGGRREIALLRETGEAASNGLSRNARHVGNRGCRQFRVEFMDADAVSKICLRTIARKSRNIESRKDQYGIQIQASFESQVCQDLKLSRFALQQVSDHLLQFNANAIPLSVFRQHAAPPGENINSRRRQYFIGPSLAIGSRSRTPPLCKSAGACPQNGPRRATLRKWTRGGLVNTSPFWGAGCQVLSCYGARAAFRPGMFSVRSEAGTLRRGAISRICGSDTTEVEI